MTQSLYRNITIDTWNAFRDRISDPEFDHCVFRGHSDACWSLTNTLTRYLELFDPSGMWEPKEADILDTFKRKAHLVTQHLPEEHETFEWLAIMQHHGAPTRLLDFTWSPYVAAFFALERATKAAAIWALDPERARRSPAGVDRAEFYNLKIRGNFETYFLSGDQPIVWVGEPRRPNERLIAQSGTFAVPGLFAVPVEDRIPEALIKITLNTSAMREQAMRDLYRMNITNATLFPGLDGLARSLAYELELPPRPIP